MAIKLTKLFNAFFHSEKSSGFVLIFCTIVSLLIANSSFGSNYIHFWHLQAFDHSIEHWVNDGLMTIFFLLVGLEIERELYIGELSDFRQALLPILAAAGGMVVPAAIHFAFNQHTPFQSGFGIPMATDIAFALGILSLVGNKVPTSLKIFLTALAIIDDLGAIIVIALFYTNDFSIFHFSVAMGIFVALLVCNRLNVNNLWIYLPAGVVMWYFMLHSGVHATITGVLLAFAIPFTDGGNRSPSYRLQSFLHSPVAFLILPIFALANTGIIFEPNWAEGLRSTNSLGIMAGLVVGKPMGIMFICGAAIMLKICKLPEDIGWMHLIGAGCLGGIGFTMSVFITLLAFNDPAVVQGSKISILLASLIASLIGFTILKLARSTNA